LNEILPIARNVDWNADSFTNTNDEWIELYNGSPRSADISGWAIDTGDKTRAFTIPPGNSIPSLGYAVFFRRETKLELDSVHEVRLVHPSGTVADSVRYPNLGDDQVYARSKDGIGEWRTDCVPSPYAKNCTIAATATSGFGLGFFRQHIMGADRPFPVDVVATNVFLALILALAMGFFGNLLNDTLESHEAQIQQWIAPLAFLIQGLRAWLGRFDHWMEKSNRAWLGFIIKLAVVLLIYGTLLAYLDPSYEFINKDGALLIVALGLSTGLVSLIDDFTILLFLKRRGVKSTVRLHSGNFVLVFFSTLFSRWTGLVPGLLVGSPAGLEDVSDQNAVTPHTSLLAIVLIVATAVIAWLLAPLFIDDAWLNTFLLLIFAAGIQSAFFEMLPLSFLHGRNIFEVNRVIWVIMFAVLGTIFLQTMLNPSGSFVNAFQSSDMLLLSLIVLLFCVLSTAIWFYFQRSEKKMA
jgi:hypothetical protein